MPDRTRLGTCRTAAVRLQQIGHLPRRAAGDEQVGPNLKRRRELRNEFANRADRSPIDSRFDGRHGRLAERRRRFVQELERHLRQRVGLLGQCAGRRRDARQDRSAGKGAVRVDQIDRDRRTKIHNNRRAVALPKPIGRQRREQPIDADAGRFFDANRERHIAIR